MRNICRGHNKSLRLVVDSKAVMFRGTTCTRSEAHIGQDG